MDQKLKEVLDGREGNHLLPFLWMHDGHHDELAGLVGQVYDSGARAFCVESRPHEHFCEQEWWDDMDVVLEEASRRDMKVWILDDKHFPTGYANGLVARKYPQLRKWQLVEEHVDVVGPAPQSAVLLSVGVDFEDECSKGCSAVKEASDAEDELIGVYAYRRNEEEEILDAAPVDLTDCVRGRYVYWDIPEGVWRVFALYKSRRGASQKDYIHLIDPESVRVLIEAVYEPHYAHYARYFGSTIAGFFSDEPSLGNARLLFGGDTPSMYDQRLGQPGLALPWSDELLERMNQELGMDARDSLAGLWYRQGDGMPEVRLAYMNAVTSLWREHFSLQLGEWCRAHGVEYIGHIIEDMNAHARLSCSGGHYFRSLDGQDMAGIDVVLHQIIPGMAHHVNASAAAGGRIDVEFFHYVLARLAASLSHIHPRMKNRAMCEVFGAYGWAEGVPMMKHLMGHMLVRGVNYFVPHAFSPKYPDPDCPPHFNGGGCNPQFSGFAKLMQYTNRVAHLLEGGVEKVSAAILYHAEAEWSGRAYMLMQKPAKRLYDAQLNYDFLPIDTLMAEAWVDNGQLCVGAMHYPMLIVPYASWLPETFLKRLDALEQEGLRLVFIDGRPENCACGEVVALGEIAYYVRTHGGVDVQLKDPFPLLRFAHVTRDGCDVIMVVNESMSEAFEGELLLPVAGQGVQVNLNEDVCFAVNAANGHLQLTLDRGESVVLIFDDDSWESFSAKQRISRAEMMQTEWTLTLKAAHGADCDTEKKSLTALYNVTGPEGDAGFSGWMCYEAEFNAEAGVIGIDLGTVGECVHAWLNGVDLGERIAAPYRYDADGVIREGRNLIRLEVTNSLVHQQPDPFSHFLQIPPSGLLGPVSLLYRD